MKLIRKLFLVFVLAICILLAKNYITDEALLLPEAEVQETATENPVLAESEEEEAPEIYIEHKDETVEIPAAYDCRGEGRAPKVEDQGQSGTCWAFAALTALETSLLPEEEISLSEDHLIHQNSFALPAEDGGAYIMAVAYLTAWQGPVLKADDPYGDGNSPEGLTAVKHVQDVRILEYKDYQAIKETVYLHGGVESSLYMDFSNENEFSEAYREETNSYCYLGEEEPNHDVVIIGWDDNYSADNFSQPVDGDGAFICQNSWGKGFGENGIFFISYYDSKIGSYNVAYTGVEGSDNFDNIYQTDLCGWSGQIGYNVEMAYFSNVYKMEQQESIKAVGFYATAPETEYEVYIVPKFQDVNSFEDKVFVTAGYLQYGGYYTIDFPYGIVVDEGTEYAIVVKIDTKDAVYPIAVEYGAADMEGSVDLSDGQGYISSGGTQWENTEENHKCNICLKVYTNQD